MRIIYLHEYFLTNAGPNRSYDVSKYLVQMGHDVTMICGLNDQGSIKSMPWYRFFQTETIDGIKVIHCNALYSNKLKVPARLWCWAKYAMLATFACIRQRRPDLIFATSTPLTIGIPGRLGARFKKVPYIFEVRDLWPEDLLDAGRIKPGLQYKLWEMLEKFCYKKARKILLVSKGFENRLIERGFDPARLQTIVLGADGDLYRQIQPDHDWVNQHGLDGKTIAIYTGAHGDANGLMQIIEAAELLRSRPDIAIVFLGEGKMRETLAFTVRVKELHNVHLLPPVPKHRLPGILAASHVGLMILKQITRPRWVTPNKIFDYMFAGLPSIVNFAGTTAEMVETDQTGVASEPGSASDLAAKIVYYADNPHEREAVGRRAREVAFARYDRKRIAQQLDEVFELALRESQPAS